MKYKNSDILSSDKTPKTKQTIVLRLSKQLKSIDDYFNEPRELKQFKREVFEKMIECIIVGDYDEDGNKLPRVARFVLKTGKEYKFTIPPKNNSKNDKNELVPFDTGNVSLFNCSS